MEKCSQAPCQYVLRIKKQYLMRDRCWLVSNVIWLRFKLEWLEKFLNQHCTKFWHIFPQNNKQNYHLSAGMKFFFFTCSLVYWFGPRTFTSRFWNIPPFKMAQITHFTFLFGNIHWLIFFSRAVKAKFKQYGIK